jgi:hypothetical protein
MAGGQRSAAGEASSRSSTVRQDEARATITRTTITPAPGTELAPEPAGERAPLLARFRPPVVHGELGAAREPYPGPAVLRLVMSVLLTALCLLTVGGAILMLLLWQQERSAGVLTTQLDRTWDLFDLLRRVERWVAFAVVPVAVAWIAVATVNVRRATGQRRNPLVTAASLVVGVGGIWLIGSEIVAPATDVLGQAAGWVLQAVFVAVPLLFLERVTGTAEARHRPLRVTGVIAIVYLGHLQFLGGLSTIDQTSGPDEWGRLGAYLVIGALLLVLGALAANEAARAIEEGTEHRYQLRHRFGESLLAQAARG